MSGCTSSNTGQPGQTSGGCRWNQIPLPTQRLDLVKQLRLNAKPAPLRRVRFLTRNGGKTSVRNRNDVDRSLQTLVKLAIEPEWEAKFEPNSYGFRPGRSCHDAVAAIFMSINKRPKYVLDADIAKCFDRINQIRLLEKLKTYPTLRHQIKTWLQAGVLDKGEIFPTVEGVPQGGPISPVLANVALHGFEKPSSQPSPTGNIPKR